MDTKEFTQQSSLEGLFITFLHHAVKFENFRFFCISSLIMWANTFKIQEFPPKIECFPQHSKICQKSSSVSLISTSIHHAMKLKDFFFAFRHLVRGLTPLKLKNFVQKLKISTTIQKFNPKKIYLIPPFIIPRNYKFLIFFWIWTVISWANTFKTYKFRPKIKISRILAKSGKIRSTLKNLLNNRP